MIESLKDGMIITVVGMGLVFAALALLWGLMAAAHRLFPPDRTLVDVLARRRREDIAPADEARGPGPVAVAEAGSDPTSAELAAVVTALALWREEQAAEESVGWRLLPLLTRWLTVGRSRQVRSWTPRR